MGTFESLRVREREFFQPDSQPVNNNHKAEKQYHSKITRFTDGFEDGVNIEM